MTQDRSGHDRSRGSRLAANSAGAAVAANDVTYAGIQSLSSMSRISSRKTALYVFGGISSKARSSISSSSAFFRRFRIPNSSYLSIMVLLRCCGIKGGLDGFTILLVS